MLAGVPRPRHCRRASCIAACALLALTLASVQAPAALSASGPFSNELREKAERDTEANTTTTTSTKPESTSNSKSVVVLALAVAAVLLGGVAFVIVRDARKIAPATDAALGESAGARHSAAQLRKRRARAKAARRQRKRNR
jgi:hypothetical protein